MLGLHTTGRREMLNRMFTFFYLRDRISYLRVFEKPPVRWIGYHLYIVLIYLSVGLTEHLISFDFVTTLPERWITCASDFIFWLPERWTSSLFYLLQRWRGFINLLVVLPRHRLILYASNELKKRKNLLYFIVGPWLREGEYGPFTSFVPGVRTACSSS